MHLIFVRVHLRTSSKIHSQLKKNLFYYTVDNQESQTEGENVLFTNFKMRKENCIMRKERRKKKSHEYKLMMHTTVIGKSKLVKPKLDIKAMGSHLLNEKLHKSLELLNY